MNETMIYIDMDGVIADFDQAIIDIFGEEFSDRIADTFWKRTCVEAKVFRHMPLIDAGFWMIVEILSMGHEICFLTSTGGMPHHIDIAKQKLDWLHEHGFGEHPVAFAMNTRGKGLYAQPGRVLIDDRQKVCDAWEAGGGTALLFERDPDRIGEIVSIIASRESR